MRSLKLILFFMIVPSLSHAERPHANPFAGLTLSQVSWKLGTLPRSCIDVSGDSGSPQLCGWRIYERLESATEAAENFGVEPPFEVICRAERAEATIKAEGCGAFTLRSTRVSVLRGKRRGGETIREFKRRRAWAQSKARERIQGARTLEQLVRVIGIAPMRCDLSGPGQKGICEWHLYAIESGYYQVALASGITGHKKLRALCRIRDGEDEGNEYPCKVSFLD
jgi:hypothetical protein